MTNPDTPDQVKVAQRHRDAAADFLAGDGHAFDKLWSHQVRGGDADWHILVQAFARFEASLTRPVANSTELQEALQMVVEDIQIAAETWTDSAAGPATVPGEGRELKEISPETVEAVFKALANQSDGTGESDALTDEQRQTIFGAAVWLDLFATRFESEWPDTARQALAWARSLKRIVGTGEKAVAGSPADGVDEIAEVLFAQRQPPYSWNEALEAEPESDAGTLLSICRDDAEAVLRALSTPSTPTAPGVDELRELGLALVAKIDAMIEDTNPIFAEMELSRGRPYTGAQIGDELEAFRAALQFPATAPDTVGLSEWLPQQTSSALSFLDGTLNINRDGSGSLAFRDDALEWEFTEDGTYRYQNLPASELRAIRDQLNKRLPRIDAALTDTPAVRGDEV